MSIWDQDGIVVPEQGSTQLAHEPMPMAGAMRSPEDGGTLGLMVHAAQGIVRDQKKMITRAKQIGSLLGGNGFYRFNVGGGTVQGPSVDMAEALAQEWGGMMYTVNILHSEPLASGGRRIHLRARVVDLKSLVCAEVDQVIATTAPPGKFANNVEQSERWHAMQSQSASSKIVRNAILRVLPSWFVEPAFQDAIVAEGKQLLDGKSLPEARDAALAAFAAFKVTKLELEEFLEQPFDMWATPQISAMLDIHKQLSAGSLSVEQWRASLGKQAATSTAPKKSALGLTAPAEKIAPSAAKEKEKATAPAAKPAAKQEPVVEREPGSDDEPREGRSY